MGKNCVFVFFFLCCCLSVKTGNTQGYKNPIIPGFYSDPSICRVNNDYYLVNSSFEFFPGIPIWHSKDLIHWEQIGNVLDRLSQLNLKNVNKSDGIGAATIRFHKGIYYVVVVLSVKGFKNFYVTSTNPAGPWSEPIVVDQNGIDPSLFFDDDGKAYFQTNRGHSFSDERAIYQSEIDIKTGRRLSEIKQLWKGSGGTYIEGPHIYKIKGYYYLLTAEGGTSYGHTVAIARSKNIWGPYEGCPHNPILTNRMSYGPIQGSGHGDLIQAHDSTWWMVHLAFRPAVDGIHFIGRETCLSPIEWDTNGWPVVNKTGMADEKVNVKTPQPVFIPNTKTPYGITDFDRPLGFEWIYMRNPDTSSYSLTRRKDYLSLRGSDITLDSTGTPTFLAIRQRHFDCKISALFDYNPTNNNEEAGLTIYMSPRFHYDSFISTIGNKKYISLRYTLDSLKQLVKQVPLENNGVVELIVKGTKKLYSFYFKLQDGTEQLVGNLNTRFLGTEVAGGFTGVIIGLYATGNGKKCTTYADVDKFEYKQANP